jgi:hypothetical protein
MDDDGQYDLVDEEDIDTLVDPPELLLDEDEDDSRLASGTAPELPPRIAPQRRARIYTAVRRPTTSDPA